MNRIISTIILFVLVNISNAQTTITLKGKITDKENSNPIEQVNVFIPEYQKTATTDAQGQFTFEELGKNSIKLQITRVGYKTVVQTVNLSSTQEVNLSLEKSSIELEEVVVTSNYATLPDNTPFPVETVSKDQLRKTGAPTMMQALAYQPGIDRISMGNAIGKPVIRGMSFNRILLYTQGTRIENQQWDDRHDLGISEDGVEKVEVINGPAALIYGADAMGGALIFHDAKPAASGTVKGGVNLGAFSNTQGLNMDGGINRAGKNGLFYMLRGGVQSHTSYLQGKEGEEEEEDTLKTEEEEKEFAANSKSQDIDAKATIGLSKKWGVSKLSYSYLNSLRGMVEIEPEIPGVTKEEEEHEQREREFEAPYQDVTTHIISLENTFLIKNSKLNFNLAYLMNDRKEFEPGPGLGKKGEEAIGLNLGVTTYDLKWTSDAAKKFGYTVGTQGMMQKNKNEGLEHLVPDADVNDFAGYGLIRYDAGKFNFLAGIRADARSIKGEGEEGEEEEMEEESDTLILIAPFAANDTTVGRPEIEIEKEYAPINGSIGIAYHPMEDLTLKLNVASGFSAPNYAELGTFGKHEGTYRFEIGNTYLKVMSNVEADLGVLFEKRNFSFMISPFYNSINNYIFIVHGGDSMIVVKNDTILPVYRFVQADANISGFEATIDIHPEKINWIDLRAGYSLCKGELKKGGSPLPFIPADKLIGELKLGPKKLGVLHNPYISFVVSHYFEQEEVAEYELKTESYTLLDAHIGFDFKMGKQLIGVHLFATNLLDTGYFNHLSLVKNIGVKEMGRNIGIQLHIPFGIKG